MRHKLTWLFSIACVWGLSACSTRNLNYMYMGEDGGDSCDGLSSAECAANPACQSMTCPGCCGDTNFVYCVSASAHLAPPSCPVTGCKCLPCEGLSEAACNAHPECEPLTCLGCNGPEFATCWDKSQPPPPLTCGGNCQQPCGQLGELDCAARTDCHRVFNDPGTCDDCASPGCCEVFDFCADGPANCTSICLPRANLCGGSYAADYLPNSCNSDGCVLLSDCPM